MTKRTTITTKIAMALASFLGLALIVCANTASTCVIHQPKAPEGLKKFSKLK